MKTLHYRDIVSSKQERRLERIGVSRLTYTFYITIVRINIPESTKYRFLYKSHNFTWLYLFYLDILPGHERGRWPIFSSPTSDFSMSVGIFLNGRLIRRMAGSLPAIRELSFSRRVGHSTARWNCIKTISANLPGPSIGFSYFKRASANISAAGPPIFQR